MKMMKVGDLILCKWQPKTSRIVDGRAIPMKHSILGKMGFIIGKKRHCYVVLFPEYGYKHDLTANVMELISASG